VRAVSTWPQLLERLDMFYELACGDQPYGYRGDAQLLDIDGNGADMLRRLGALFSTADAEIRSLRRTAYGNANLALGMLSDQAGRWSRSRRYLWEAIRANPDLLGSWPVLRRLLKVCAGKRIVASAQKVLGGGL
jgi:hypothetical protein